MYNPNDTIVAISSPTGDQRVILRISGPQAIEFLNRIFRPSASNKAGITKGGISVKTGLILDAVVYLFCQPNSYTGDDLAEIHTWANHAVTEKLMEQLLAMGARPASPGEFTARAYLNGKMDLAQAEAVNEVITASNTFQLAAGQRLLAGHLAQTITQIRSLIIDCLAGIEADLDFSTEDIDVAPGAEAKEKLIAIKRQLQELLSDSVRCESVIDLPAVGIAGAPNAGKSTLLNKLLGRERSIVSKQRKTTRDVLTGELALSHCRCVLFDCAGLTVQPTELLDQLAQQAAIEALRNALVVIFCVDITKTDWEEDLEVFRLIQPKVLIPAATKADLPKKRQLPGCVSQLAALFGVPFTPISAKTGEGLQIFTDLIDKKLLEQTFGTSGEARDTNHGAALTARHRRAVTDALENIDKAVDELNASNDEVAAILLRAAHQNISDIEQPRLAEVDEKVLERIFSRFCIGK